jgi:hypothetical protein
MRMAGAVWTAMFSCVSTGATCVTSALSTVLYAAAVPPELLKIFNACVRIFGTIFMLHAVRARRYAWRPQHWCYYCAACVCNY